VTEVHGFVADGFEPVADVLAHGARLTIGDRTRQADLGAGGGAFAAFVDGECVVDLWAGYRAPDIAWAEDTTAVIMSATKGLTALCAHILADGGHLDVDAPVVSYWPEFAAAVATGAPAWEPGTRHGYHGLTFGWLVGELVRRVSGQSLGSFFRQRVARPLAVECQIGTPAADLTTVARVMEWSPSPSGREATLSTLDPDSRAGRSVLAGAHGHLFADEQGRPRFASFMNTPAVLQAEIGAIGATATARGLARVYAALARGETLVSRPSVARFSQEQVCGGDAVMGVPTRWAMGYTREPPAVVPGLPPQHGPNDEAFGHMGAGGQIGFADPVAGVGCGFVRNHLERQAMPLMGACLVDALYRCLSPPVG
jgi:CubicO group peptidase (beta-lactamase class C family)